MEGNKNIKGTDTNSGSSHTMINVSNDPKNISEMFSQYFKDIFDNGSNFEGNRFTISSNLNNRSKYKIVKDDIL